MSIGIWEKPVEEIYQELRLSFNSQFSNEPVELEDVVVFGSYGRGVATDDSDLDILFVVSLTEDMTDSERRDLFFGISSCFDESSVSGVDAPIDAFASRVAHRDAFLAERLEPVPQGELESAPCLVYSLSDKEKRTVLYP